MDVSHISSKLARGEMTMLDELVSMHHTVCANQIMQVQSDRLKLR